MAILFLAVTFIAGLIDAGPADHPVSGPAAQNTQLEIRVVDDYTARPLPSAEVTLWGDGIEIGTAQTDSRGIATFALPTGAGEPPELPGALTLSPNYPNPFLDETRVDITVPEEQTITATVYNILGQRVATQQLPVQAGYHTLTLSLGHLATGVYFLRVDGRTSQTVSLFRMGSGVHRAGPVFSVAPGPAPGADPAGTPGPIPVRAGQATPASTSTTASTGTTTSTGATATASASASTGTTTSTGYTIRVEKDRYDVHEGPLAIPPGRSVPVPLSRNNLVEFVVTDGEGAPAPRQLEITFGDFHTSITTPQTLTLKSGVYSASGDIGEGVALAHKVEIPSVDTTVVLTFEEAGVKLEGAPDAPAIDASYDLHIPIVYPGEAISVDPDLLNDGRVLRTEIEVVTNPDATIAEVNSLLEKYDAQIVSMLQDNTVFIIRVPDPGDVASLNQLVAAIENEPIVLLANKSVIVEDPEPLYDSYRQGEIQQIPGHNTLMERIDHHLAARAHAAWNLRDAITEIKTRPWVVVADFFGDGPPGAGYNANVLNIDYATGNVNSHGYHVLGIISGMFDNVETLDNNANDVTGIFPERLNVYTVDLADTTLHTWPRRMNEIISTIGHILSDDSNARIVVNTSLNSRSLNDQAPQALSWIIRVRGMRFLFLDGLGLEDRFIHFTSTGNNRIVGGNIVSWAARDNSIFAYAVLGDMTMDGHDVPKLTNTFVVENRVNTQHNDTDELQQRPVPGCASNRSIMGGNLSAMGTEVWSFGGFGSGQELSDPFASNMSGTSMATPQAAGIAAYVWAVNPSLSVSQVMDIVRSTAEERATNTVAPPGETCHEVVPQPVADAYAAVLLAGGSDARRALLDVNGNGTFDHDDIEEFLEIYLDTLKAGTLDYSRFDLNGDGITGGEGTDRFDLTMDGGYAVVQQNIEETLIAFDEGNLTDLEILCYYAYSDIYEGDAEERRELLKGICFEDDNDYDTGTVTDIDGNVYQTVKIGDQWWMAENLRVSRYRNGDAIPTGLSNEEWSDTTTGTYAIYPHDKVGGIASDEEMVEAYGALYNWYAVDDERGLCPSGWHVPSDAEWKELEMYLGMTQEQADETSWRGTDEGGKLKSTRTQPASHPRWAIPNTGATNESGFSALPAGIRSPHGDFFDIGFAADWWSSTRDAFRAWYREVDFDYSDVRRSSRLHRGGLSVRCVRD
ncbi:MAG: T9SS C-terminal target domain-containing protein [Balneolaceae bacterium]|nr:MAG: T9SS C-terminal target domain-containing protein [Balneolaceae bacterium]